ncbi:transcriptional regulator with XRE-family HTH domain [Actinopolyspora lacussalsi]|nr:transcriptional regulator with XRE-family HTH domain [Actinopolyspora lacussalsi]
MGKKPGPSVRRRQLGAMLRQLRQDADTTRKTAAEWLEIGEPTLSKIELGRQSIKGPHVRLLCQLYDVDASTVDTLLRLAREANQRGWWTAYRDTVPSWFRHYVGLEGDAADIWAYEAEFVPGLLQTAEYTKAITRASRPEISDEELNREITVRRERQALLDDEQPPQLHLIINEAVVWRQVGGPEVMREQLEHLLRSAKLDHVSLRVLPFSAGAHAAMTGSFILIRFPDEDTPAFVYVENDRGGVYQENPGDIERYTLVREQLATLAHSEDDTRALLEQLVSP